MATGWWLVIAAGLGIVIANLRTMRPLWASPALERSQKIAQTVLMWLVPGSYLAVRAAIVTSGALPAASTDPTLSRPAGLGSVEWNAADHYRNDHTFDDGGYGGGHHGDSGGGHHDGGGDH